MPSGPDIVGGLHAELASVAGSAALRLSIAALLGGVIGLEREYKHRPAGLRTNMFICVGSCLFTVLSGALATGNDSTRIAAQIITGIGFIGAGSILHHSKKFVSGLTTAATLFVVASIGMAAGGGLYLTAAFATLLVLIVLLLLGKTERLLNLKLMVFVYEVIGPSAEEIRAEVNRALEPKHVIMQNVQIAPAGDHVRVQFELEGTPKAQHEYHELLAQSPLLKKVFSLGPLEPE